MKKIIQIEPWIGLDESNYIKQVVNKTFLTEAAETKRFEDKIKKKFKSKYALAVSNWTNGLYMSLKAFNIGKGDEVIVPNVTFIATVNSVIMAGATPVICEIDEKNLSLDINHFKKIISKKTKAVIPVHLYGYCCNLDILNRICSKKKIKIIEDAAQAIGAKYKKKYLGTIGQIGGFSFYGNKIITTGEGGVILTNSAKLKKKLYELKNHGRSKKGIFKHDSIGYNFMFTEMQAAIGNIQLNKLNKILKKKETIFKLYKKELSKIKNINFMTPVKFNKPVHWFSNIFTKKKNGLKKYLKDRNIQTRDIFYPINFQPCYKKTKLLKITKKRYVISEKIFDNGISLPSSYSLSKSQQKFIIKTIKDYFNQAK